jgi:hypothetical protein
MLEANIRAANGPKGTRQEPCVIQFFLFTGVERSKWIPAFAGMTARAQDSVFANDDNGCGISVPRITATGAAFPLRK